jgi:hypothetical protein
MNVAVGTELLYNKGVRDCTVVIKQDIGKIRQCEGS